MHLPGYGGHQSRASYDYALLATADSEHWHHHVHHLCLLSCSYAAALKAYTDVGRRIAAAIKQQQSKAPVMTNESMTPASGAPRLSGVVNAQVQIVSAASADVQIDHHLLGAAIQTQVRNGKPFSQPCSSSCH